MTLSPVSIRDALPEDAEDILALWSRADATPSVTDTLADVKRALSLERVAVLIAECDDELVGSVIGAFDGWRGNIYRLAVHPAYRRRGIARMLLEAIDARLRAWGAKRVTALVEKDHPWAVGFWRSSGYAIDERIVRYVESLGSDTT